MSCIRTVFHSKHRFAVVHLLRSALNCVPIPACLSAAVLLLFAASSQAQVSLATIVDLAQRNSSAVKLADADVHRAVAVLQESKDVYVPNFIIGSSIGPPSIGFSFSQPSIASASMQSLFFSIAQRRYIEAASVGIQAATLSLKDAREQVALDASAEYIELDTLTRELAAGREQLEDANRLITIEDQRQQAGVDAMSEVLQARLTAAQLKLKQMHLESRAASLVGQLAALTGLPGSSILTDSASIPEIPEVKGRESALKTSGVEAAEEAAQSRQLQARGDEQATKIRPQIAFGAQYNRDATSLNNYNTYFSAKKKFKADNFSAGFNITIPVFDLAKRAKARESAAEALRATVEAEQAQRLNDVQIATISGSLLELDALAEVASLKQQIAGEQLKTVRVELLSGNGAGVDSGSPPQPSPKAEQLALIDERQKAIEALDATFELGRARLNLLRALGHIDDWLHQIRPASPPVSLLPSPVTVTPEGTTPAPK